MKFELLHDDGDENGLNFMLFNFNFSGILMTIKKIKIHKKN